MSMTRTNEILQEMFFEEDCSQREFADKVKLKRTSNLSMWLSDSIPISFEKLEEIAGHLGYKLEITLKKK